LFYGFVVLSLIGAILASTKWNFGGNLETAKAGN
jgi:hypothetical protein